MQFNVPYKAPKNHLLSNTNKGSACITQGWVSTKKFFTFTFRENFLLNNNNYESDLSGILYRSHFELKFSSFTLDCNKVYFKI